MEPRLTPTAAPAAPKMLKQRKYLMDNEATWKLIMATAEPVPMRAVNSDGTDTARQLRAALWINGLVTLTLNEIKELRD